VIVVLGDINVDVVTVHDGPIALGRGLAA